MYWCARIQALKFSRFLVYITGFPIGISQLKIQSLKFYLHIYFKFKFVPLTYLCCYTIIITSLIMFEYLHFFFLGGGGLNKTFKKSTIFFNLPNLEIKMKFFEKIKRGRLCCSVAKSLT